MENAGVGVSSIGPQTEGKRKPRAENTRVNLLPPEGSGGRVRVTQKEPKTRDKNPPSSASRPKWP